MKRLLTLISVFILSVSFINAQENVKELNILHWNDFHARNVPYKKTKIKDGDTTKYFVGGTSSMLGYLNKNRKDNSIVLNGGDDFQGSPISSITRGLSQIKLLNLYKLDAFVLGNHDFDYGQYALDSALMIANFNSIACNLFDVSKKSIFSKSNVIKEVNGVKVGIIGLAPEELMLLSIPKNVSEILILNRDSVVNANITELKNNKCDLIILLSHNGTDKDSLYAAKYGNDISIIIGGHSHTRLFKPKVVNGVLICQAGSAGEYLGKLDFKFDLNTHKVLEYKENLIETKFDSTIYDRNAQELVDNMEAEIKPEMSKVIGVLEVEWKRYGNLAQWQTDVMRVKSNTDIGFLNSGGVRKDMAKGNITVGDIWEINPFDNTINTFTVSGLTLKNMLAYSFGKYKNPDGMLVSGLFIKYNKEKLKSGSEDFFISIEVNGVALDENKRYSISTNNYVVSQFEKYFGKQDEKIKFIETNVIFRNVILDGVIEQKVINQNYEERIIGQ